MIIIQLEVTEAYIVAAITKKFRTFGAGSAPVAGNPIAGALQDTPASFAMGVDVAEVVAFVLQYACDSADVNVKRR